ncbi:hypothetical protein TELCIR_17917 [Teladorsagia circumcincta]|uniref:Receptor ligand binding region domain-containing protein n=1 Tax=Teladorsagia circumcincta TaxID=45464 RepID=A0A2G9TRH1_TELCI|nr:hypothetical protein TELCIR_17917 [Teladorsagia circumcincta]
MIPVATMANFWNVPIIAYMATANVLSNKKIYKTLVRTSLRTMNTIAESTAAFIKHYKWKKIDDTNGFDNRMIVPFVERLATVGLKEQDISMTNIYGYVALFDSLKMFATAGRRVLNRTGQFSALSDGKLMWDTMRRITIPGVELGMCQDEPRCNTVAITGPLGQDV